jgi:hypothetical protein
MRDFQVLNRQVLYFQILYFQTDLRACLWRMQKPTKPPPLQIQNWEELNLKLKTPPLKLIVL